MIFLLTLLLQTQAHASGWFHVDLLPGTVFTESSQGTIAITKEAGTYPSEYYECTLKLEGDISQVASVEMDGSWKRFILTSPLEFADSDFLNQVIETPNRGSRCLEWGPEYWDDGFPQRDCLKYEESFKTMRNTMVMMGRNNQTRGITLKVICEKWLSVKKFTDNDDFAFLMLGLKGNFPLFWDLELD
ncbi:MAG: hypothetical protein LW878_00635 [Proteobacteria bacterium]|jgi:hypothetical protein|nr:hypothetical protein [Pseudomonadota bacterium]